MRVVETDNFGGDYPDEKFASPYKFTFEQAKEIADFYNRTFGGENAPRYWTVVENDYVLKPGFEP